MSTVTQVQEQHKEKLRREFGPQVIGWLGDPNIIEIMANPDGALWVDTLSDGLVATGETLSSTQIDMAIGTVAAYYGRVVNEDAPRLQAELPLGGQRFQGVRPPGPADPRPALDIVEANVFEHALVAEAFQQQRAPPGTPRAAHLEHIGEIRAEADRQGHVDRAQAVIAHTDPVDAQPVAENA